MTTERNPPVPGWYSDPRGQRDLRWWDGSAWTEEVADSPTLGVSPVPRSPEFQQQPGGSATIVIGGKARPLASWWPRFGAYLIDGVISLAFLLPFIIGCVVLVAGVDWQAIDIVDNNLVGVTADDSAAVALAALSLIGGIVLVGITYQPLTMARQGPNNGRTWGMQMLGIRVVNNSGVAMGYWSAVLRQFGVMVVLYGVLSGIGNSMTLVGGSILVLVAYLWPLWDRENRAGQDFICSTHVVRD